MNKLKTEKEMLESLIDEDEAVCMHCGKECWEMNHYTTTKKGTLFTGGILHDKCRDDFIKNSPI